MPHKIAKRKVIPAAKKNATAKKIRTWENSKDAADAILGDCVELEPSKKLRKIKFVDAIGLLNSCNEEMHKLDAAIGAKTKELKKLREEGENQAAMLDAAMHAYETASTNNERIDARLVAIEMEIASKELEATGAKSAAEELKRVYDIARGRLSQFVATPNGPVDESFGSIERLMALSTEKLGQASSLKSQMKAFEKQATEEQNREDMLGEHVMDLRDKLELNVEQIAGLHGALSFLNAKRIEKQDDIAIILKKSGFGEISALVSTLRAQIDEANRTIVATQMTANADISNRDGMITNLKGNVKELRILVSEQKTRFDALLVKAKGIIGTKENAIRTLECAIAAPEASGERIIKMTRVIAALMERLAAAGREQPKAGTRGRVIGVMPSKDEELKETRGKLAEMSRNYEQAITRHGRLKAAHERTVAMVDRHVLVMDSILSRPFSKGAAKKSLSKFRSAFKALDSSMTGNTDR
jgi:chromosome segregation ATPase